MRLADRRAEVVAALAEGSDERVVVDPRTGRNRYHLDPSRFDDLFQRGSCTAGSLTPHSYEVARAFLDRYDERDPDELVAEQADRLRGVVSCAGDEPVDVWFGPSGSDLVYYPNLFQLLLAPDRAIVHVLSCPEELGSGSQVAAASRFYARTNQFGEAVEQGAPISPEHAPVVVRLAARDRQGRIMSRRRTITRLVDDNPDAACIGSLVFGSKSGILDDLDVIADHPAGSVLWVVDLCQFRVDRRLIADLLGAGATVMLTGSKFFGAPPFCGALLVPRSWSERLAAVADPTPARPFGRIFSAYDLPPTTGAVRAQLPARPNRGLRLRWEIALDEMEAYGAWPEDAADAVIAGWNALVTDRLAASPTFSLMPDQHLTNPSIVSFQVLAGGRGLDHAELRTLFEQLVTAEHDGLSEGRRRVFFGQPVQYGDRAFIRLAIGSAAVRGALEAGSRDPADDLRLIELIEAHARGGAGRTPR